MLFHYISSSHHYKITQIPVKNQAGPIASVSSNNWTDLGLFTSMDMWLWINTYENTIFNGMNIHKSQLF